MFNGIQRAFYRTTKIFALIGFLSTAHAFELDTKNLREQKDFFSNLKKESKYKKLSNWIDNCSAGKDLECYDLGKNFYTKSKFVEFKSLIVSLVVENTISKNMDLKDLNFIALKDFSDSDLAKIIDHFDSESLNIFFEKFFIDKSNRINTLFFSKPNRLCKFTKRFSYSQLVLKELRLKAEFFDKNYSDFPCGLNLDDSYEVLKKDIANSKKKYPFKYDYKFAYLRKKVSLQAYRAFPKHKKKKLSYRTKKIWSKLVNQKPYIQKRIVQNLFYRGEYDLLAGALRIGRSKAKKKISNETMVYVAKAFIAKGKYEELLSLTDKLEYVPSKWSEEILLMRSSAFMRQGKFEKAKLELKSLLDNAVNLRLSGLYWLWVSANKTQDAVTAQTSSRQILNSYPFSYYGLVVAKKLFGVDFFKTYVPNSFIKQSFVDQIDSVTLVKLKFYYTYDYKNLFKKTFSRFEKKLNPQQKALFSLVFYNLDHKLEVIRSLNLVWDEDSTLRSKPFVTSSFPWLYKNVSDREVKSLKWMSSPVVHAVIRQESAFNKEARSSSNAMGLMQLLPSTAKEVAVRAKQKEYRKKEDLFKPDINIFLGSRYMDRLVAASDGYLPYAFASYNAGPGRMYRWSQHRSAVKDLRQGFMTRPFDPIDDLWIEELPWSETRFYAKALLRNTGIYLALSKNKLAFKCEPFWKCHK